MTSTLPPSIKFQPLAAGKPIPGGKVYTYRAGTLIPLATSDGSGTNTNPIILDANGSCDMWLTTGSAYKINVTDSSDVQQDGWPVDNVVGVDYYNGVLLETLADPTGASLVGFKQDGTSAPERTVQDKLRDMPFNPKDFGIVGNGTNNDTSAFVAMVAKVTPGRTIDITGLTISVEANTAIDSKTDLTFTGDGTFKLINPTSGTDPFIFTMLGSSRITFRGITFDAQISDALGNARRGVWVKTGADITFEDCDFSKCRDGVYTGNGAGVGPSRVNIVRCRMVAELSYTATRADTDKSIPQSLAMFTYGGEDSTVRDCYCSGCGIPVYSEEGGRVTVENNRFIDGWDSQVYIKGEKAHVTGNFIKNAGKDGIKVVQTGASNAYRAIITGNTIEKFAMTRTDGSVGIHVQGRHHLIANNEILLPTHAEAAGTSSLNGIIVGGAYSDANNNKVFGANQDAYQVGIRIWPSTVESIKDIRVTENTLTDMKFAILTQTTPSMDMSNVTISNNHVARVWSLIYSSGNDTAASPKASQFTITNNWCYDCVAYVIFLQKCIKPVVAYNHFINCSGAESIYLDASTLCVVLGNQSDGTNATLIGEANTPTYKLRANNFSGYVPQEALLIRDGLTAPTANIPNVIQMWGDSVDGDMKARFADGVVKVVVADT